MEKNTFSLFELLSLSWISVSTCGLILALFGLFHASLLIIVLLLIGITITYLYKKDKFSFQKPDKTEYFILLIIAAIGIIFSLYTTPTIFGGRDEGTYSNAAILLTKDHGLSHESEVSTQFFEIYGPGKALNFPGFYYSPEGQLYSQFLPGYISWIAIIYDLLGLKGLAFVNLLPFITFALSFYYILKKVLRKRFFLTSEQLEKQEEKFITSFSLLGTALFATTFPLLLFYKYTLSEIYFGALLWFTFYLILRYYERKSFGNYLLIFLPFIPMVFSRIEAIGFFFFLFSLFALKDFTHMRQPKYQFVYALLGIVVAISLVYNSNFFIDTAKNILEPFIKEDSAPGPSSAPLVSDDLKNFYVPKVLYNYNILPFLVMGALYIIYLLKDKRLRLLIPFFFFSPTLIYLVDANISLDHPWMLRRFLFAIIPLFILYAILFLHELAERGRHFKWLKIIAYAVPVLMLLLNLTLLFPNQPSTPSFITFSQNRQLLVQTQQLSMQFNQDDLVLVSQNSSGSGWSLMSEPLRNILGQPAVYFFNPNDFEKLNLDSFNNIYLISSDKEIDHYKDLRKEKVSDYTIDNSIIEPLKNPLEPAKISPYQIQGAVYRLEK